MPHTPALIASAEAELARRDPVMAQLIARHGPSTLCAKRRDPFHTICVAIIGQQLSTKAADTIQKRVAQALKAGARFRPAHFLGADPAVLRACGLSTAKAKWLQALAAQVDKGEFSFAALKKMDDAAAAMALDALPGIGPWTAEMMLIFALDRIDVFSPGDVGLRRMIDRLYNKGRKLSDARTLKIAATWSPYRSVACWYLWRAIDAR